MALDNYPGDLLPGVTAPLGNGVAVTPNDTTDLTYVTRGLYIGGAGNVAVELRDTTTVVTLVGVPAGTLLPIRVKKVKSTNTTATSIVALW